MKTKSFFGAVAVLAVLFTACSKDNAPKGGETPQPTPPQKRVNITAINSGKSQLVSVAADSIAMEQKTFAIGAHILSSTTFDAKRKTFGYHGSDTIYRLIDVEAGAELKQIPLPVFLNLTVVDTARNVLIGHYYIADNEGGVKDYVMTVDLSDGSILSNEPFYADGEWQITYFFRDAEGEYVLLSAANELVFINPYTGNVLRTVKVAAEEEGICNGVYDARNNRLIGMTTAAGQTPHIIVADVNTGKILSRVSGLGAGETGYLFGESAYDAETNSFVQVSGNMEVMFFDVETGKLNQRYPLDFTVSSLKVWRSGK